MAFEYQYDMDGDGQVNRQEYQDATVAQRSGGGTSEADLEMGFMMMDTDGDGLVTRDEYIGMIELAGYEMDMDMLDMVWNMQDMNGDGFIDWDEFWSTSMGGDMYGDYGDYGYGDYGEWDYGEWDYGVEDFMP